MAGGEPPHQQVEVEVADTPPLLCDTLSSDCTSTDSIAVEDAALRSMRRRTGQTDMDLGFYRPSRWASCRMTARETGAEAKNRCYRHVLTFLPHGYPAFVVIVTCPAAYALALAEECFNNLECIGFA